jgi:hypothetical protein
MTSGWPVAPARAATDAAEALKPATATSGTLVARLLAALEVDGFTPSLVRR